MKENIVQKLTSKDDKYACTLTDRIVAESHDTDEWYEYFEDVASLMLIKQASPDFLFIIDPPKIPHRQVRCPTKSRSNVRIVVEVHTKGMI